MGFIAFLLVICVIPLTSALQWEGAGATAFSASPGWNPKPTAAPLGPYDLRRRQQKTITYDNTCGYESGIIGRLFPILLFSTSSSQMQQIPSPAPTDWGHARPFQATLSWRVATRISKPVSLPRTALVTTIL